MIRPNLINIRSSERPKQPLAEKKMLWPPSFQGDECLRFPSVNSIRQRYDSDHHDFLIDEFFLAISQSVERIFIIDRYFLRPHEGETVKDRLDYFLYSMESGSFHAKEVKIISSGKSELQSSQDRFQSFADKFNQRPSQSRNQQALTIELKYFPERLVHDRFAIIDDELWHFGGTVGGYEKQFSVASRGWRASECGADDLFKNIWRMQ